MTGAQDPQAGAATVLLLALAAALAATSVPLLAVAGTAVARARAESVADVAALAAATALQEEQPACGAAAALLASEAAVLEGCRVAGQEVEVVVRLDLTGPLAAFGAVRAVATAGPDEARGPGVVLGLGAGRAPAGAPALSRAHAPARGAPAQREVTCHRPAARGHLGT